MADPFRARRWRDADSAGAYQPEPEAHRVQQLDGYPEGGNVTAVLAWVGDDRVRARAALDVELAKPDPRSSVVAPLDRLLAR